MTRTIRRPFLTTMVAALVLGYGGLPVIATPPGQRDAANVQVAAPAWLGTVTLPRPVMADGRRLEAGTYRVRLTTATATPVVGQSATSERWVEFVRDGKTAGRALAPVVTASEVAEVTPPSSVPPVGSARVQTLKTDNYLRVWFNHHGDQVIVYLPYAVS